MRTVQKNVGMIIGGQLMFISGIAFADEFEFDLNQDGWTERIVTGLSDGNENDNIPSGVSTLVAEGTCCDAQGRWICTDCLIPESP